MDTYREMLADPYFMPQMTVGEEQKLPVTLRWGGSEDAEGLSVPVELEGNPHFCELYFDGESVDANLMLEINGKWFYKAPGVNFVDLMPAFFKKPLDGATKLDIKLFAPPASGKNDVAQGNDWDVNYYYTLKELPKLRVRYAPVMEKR